VPTPTAYTAGGIPIYERPLGFNFTIVAEGKPGGSRRPVGSQSFNWDPADPAARPDLQMLVARPLGDGSTTVCDNTFPMIGGVPAVDPPDYSLTQPISDAINDLGCRFVNGSGLTQGRPSPADACTVGSDGDFHFVGSGTTMQFCGTMGRLFDFPMGDTLVTVKLRDTGNNLSKTAHMIVRVTAP